MPPKLSVSAVVDVGVVPLAIDGLKPVENRPLTGAVVVPVSPPV